MRNNDKCSNVSLNINNKDFRYFRSKTGFSLVELMLAMGVAIALSVLAFILGNKWLQSSRVDGASQQIRHLNIRANSYSATAVDYGMLSSSPSSVFASTDFDSSGSIASNSWGRVDVVVNSVVQPNDSYAIVLHNVPAYGCAKIVLQNHLDFGKVSVNGSDVWEGGNPFVDLELLTNSCAGPSNVVAFTSRRMRGVLPTVVLPICTLPFFYDTISHSCRIPSTPVATCLPPSVVNPVTGACGSDCLSPNVWSPTGVCGPTTCPSPNVIVPATGACEPTTVCPPMGSTIRNPTTNRCECPLSFMTYDATTGLCACPGTSSFNPSTSQCESGSGTVVTPATSGYWGFAYANCETWMPRRPAGNWIAINPTVYKTDSHDGSGLTHIPPPPGMFVTGAFVYWVYNGNASSLTPADIQWHDDSNDANFRMYCKDISPATPAGCSAGTGPQGASYPALSHSGVEYSRYRDGSGACNMISVGCNNGTIIFSAPSPSSGCI